MTTEERIRDYLAGVGVTQSVEKLVAIVSNTYHRFEAECYDVVHDEIGDAIEPWRIALKNIEGALPSSIRVLDIGTGTGFAAERVVQAFGGRISELTCQDLSPDMLRECRNRLLSVTSNTGIQVKYVAGSPEELFNHAEEYDLVTTNSLLHHLLSVGKFLNTVRGLVRRRGFYLAGHEPSRRFYEDRCVYRWSKAYRASRKACRLFSLDFYRRRLTRKRPRQSIADLTNRALVDEGVLSKPLPQGAVSKLIDIHVPPIDDRLPFWGESGFDPHGLCQKYLTGFETVQVITYQHIKGARIRMGILWRAIESALARKYPDSGANFLMVAQRAE